MSFSLLQVRIPESRGLFVIILLTNLLNNVFREIITVSNGNLKASATAAVVMFVLVAVLFFGPLTIVYFVYKCILKHSYISFISSSIQTIGALLYYYGDNITFLIDTFNPELGCEENCVTGNRVAAVISLGLALIIIQIVPPIVHKFKKEGNFKKTPDWNSALDMITVLVKMDALYTTIVLMAHSSDEFCSTADVATSISLITIFVIVGVVVEAMQYYYALTTNENKKVFFTHLTTLGLFAFIICLPLYILADNFQPLDCAFRCDTFAANTTIHEINCNQTANNGVRLAFNAIVFIVVSVFSVVYFIGGWKFTAEKSTNCPEVKSEKSIDHQPLQEFAA